MKIDRAAREFWEPEMSPLPPGFVAVQAKFTTSWVSLVDVDDKKCVLIAGPDVTELPHPGGTVTLPLGRTEVSVKLIGPASVEVVIRPGGVIDVE